MLAQGHDGLGAAGERAVATTVIRDRPHADRPIQRKRLGERLWHRNIVPGMLEPTPSGAETPDHLTQRIRRAADVVVPERLVAAPDSGTEYASRKPASRKLETMVAGPRIVTDELVL